MKNFGKISKPSFEGQRKRLQLPYGQWPSPISAEQLAAKSLGLGHCSVYGERLWWQESRAAEGGRCTLMCYDLVTGEQTERLAAPYGVRSRVHEYGGAASVAVADGIVFVESQSQHIHHLKDGEVEPLAITLDTEGADVRYGDLAYDPLRQRIVAVRERHFPANGASGVSHPLNDLVAIGLKNGAETVLSEGADFFMHGRVSPDGNMLAWVCWCHPHMPWDAASLWIADLDSDGCTFNPRQVAGGIWSGKLSSALEPVWSQACDLYFIDDQSGHWTPWVLKHDAQEPHALGGHHVDFAHTPFCLGNQGYGLLNQHDILCRYFEAGRWSLATLSRQTGSKQTLSGKALANITDIQQICTLNEQASSGSGDAVIVGSCPDVPLRIVLYSQSSQSFKVIRESMSTKASSEQTLQKCISQAEFIMCPRNPASKNMPAQKNISNPRPHLKDLPENSKECFQDKKGNVYGYFFAPRLFVNGSEVIGLEGDLPPLIVMCHGGPTAQCDTGFNLKVQFWTSRGFAVLQVDYAGSTGYGRAYRDLLYGKWGELDASDCLDLTQDVIARGLVDAKRVAIMGGSAGGLTALAALAHSDLFVCGCVRYAVTDLEQLAMVTHKFEAHYMNSLVGPLPKAKALYRARSPRTFADKITAATLFQQGDQDFVTPPAQSEGMTAAIRAAGGTLEYIVWSGEGHGFRGSEAVSGALQAELDFVCEMMSL